MFIDIVITAYNYEANDLLNIELSIKHEIIDNTLKMCMLYF